MSTPNREILARFAASLRGHQDGGLLYVGALRELYERDNLPIPGGLDFGQGRMVGFEISIYLQVRHNTRYTRKLHTNAVHYIVGGSSSYVSLHCRLSGG